MTEQEKFNGEMQMRLALQDAKFNVFMDEMRDFKREMRDRDNRRAEEIAALSASTDLKIAEIRQSMEGIRAEGRNQTIVTLIGVAAMVIAVLLK